MSLGLDFLKICRILPNKKEFKIQLLTIKDTEELIKKAKNSWTLCDDDISMNVVKRLNKKIAPHLTHLYNAMTITSIYPSALKVNKMLPTLKPGKDKFLIDSYRPINILHPFDKLYQEHVKNYLFDFLIENDIILPNHQGGIKKHGTDTALAYILDNIYRNKENNQLTCVLQTDLSSAYDTIDHKILIEKLEFYGIRNESLK